MLVALTGCAAGLLVALFVLPIHLAGGSEIQRHRLPAAVADAFTEYWTSGRRALPADLTEIVDFWQRFHAIKAVTAVALLVVSVALGVVVWRRFLRLSGVRTVAATAHVLAGTTAGLLALFATLVVVANIQGTVAPLSSVLTLLPDRHPGPLEQTTGQIGQQLADRATSGHRWPPLTVMVNDFGRFHAVLAILAATVSVVSFGLAASLWRARVRASAPSRRATVVLVGMATVAGVFGASAAVVCFANITVAARPAPALLAFFQGGW